MPAFPKSLCVQIAGAYFAMYMKAIEYCALEDPSPSPRTYWGYFLFSLRDVFLSFDSSGAVMRSQPGAVSASCGRKPKQDDDDKQRRFANTQANVVAHAGGGGRGGPFLIRQPLAPPGSDYSTAVLRILSDMTVQYILYDMLLTLCLRLTEGSPDGAAPPLLSFAKPWRGITSVSVLWQRWHQMFRMSFLRLAYRPARALVRRLRGGGKGRGGAAADRVDEAVGVMAVFLLSGLTHEYMCWAAFGAAEGWQLAFFALHGLAVLLEQATGTAQGGGRGGRRCGAGRGWAGALRGAGAAAFCVASSALFMRPWLQAGYHRDFWHPVSPAEWALQRLAGLAAEA
ncbi:hypothetical protein GPECTOR_234g545 [Gonium pectorale]|uniref:Wax synthase domain-containing protein n=1 Tax=Gonium pectorale TaxID=33097 RepID=A0A150FWI0_GONPE|nr:hypothetical protein GPECTOR_234g545 [Gonium pectorale]|eukprot:KXZ41959.1 hypothetical protein GPECTOR_234g545 [Gonium pectorale]